MAGQLLRIEVDPGDVLRRTFTELEQKQLPYVMQQTVNRTAEDLQRTWERVMPVVFDRPAPRTRRSIFLKRARYVRNSTGQRESEAAIVGIKDKAGGGTAPATYLLRQVVGGERNRKGLEAALQRIGLLHGQERAIPAQGAPLDGYGNIRSGIVQQVLAQLGANREVGSLSNETPVSRARNARRGTRKAALKEKNRRFFAVRGSGGPGYVTNRDGSTRPSHLRAGIYQRQGKYRLRSIFVFTRRASYRQRFDIFGLAQKIYNRRFPFYFEREMAKALETARIRGRA